MPSDLRGKLHTKQAIAQSLDASLSFVDRKIRRGEFKVIRLSAKMTRIDGDSVADFLEGKATVASYPRGAATGKASKDRGAA
jgi:hypothetical protein